MKVHGKHSSPNLSVKVKRNSEKSFPELDSLRSLLDANEALMNENLKLKEENHSLRNKIKHYKFSKKACKECSERKQEQGARHTEKPPSNSPQHSPHKELLEHKPYEIVFEKSQIVNVENSLSSSFEILFDNDKIYNLRNSLAEKKKSPSYGDYAKSVYKNQKSSSEKHLTIKSVSQDQTMPNSNNNLSQSTKKKLRIWRRDRLRSLSSNEEINTKIALKSLRYTTTVDNIRLQEKEFLDIIQKQFEKAPSDELLPRALQGSFFQKDSGTVYYWGDFYQSHEEEYSSTSMKLLRSDKPQKDLEPSQLTMDETLADTVISVCCGANTIMVVAEGGISLHCSYPVSGPVCIGISRYPPYKGPNFSLNVKYILGRNITKVAAGPFHFAAVTDANEVVMWGENRIVNSQISGQLGFGGKCLSLPRFVEGISGTVLDIACGVYHTVAVSSLGVYSCGSNAFSQLGREGKEDEFQLVPGLFNDEGVAYFITSVGCGMYHTVALTKCNRLFVWGKNQGLVLDRDHDHIFHIPRLITQFHEIRNVVCGYTHTIITAKDGIYACGSTLFGKLGVGFTKKDFSYFEKIPSLQVHEIDHITCGPHSSFAIKRNGEVYTWGMFCNASRSDHQYTPRLMTEISNKNLFIRKVSAGITHSCFLTDKRATNCYNMVLKACQISDQLFSIRRIKSALPHNPSLFKHIQERVIEKLKTKDPQLPSFTLDKAYITYTFRSSTNNKTIQYITITNTSNMDLELIAYIPIDEEDALQETHVGVHPNNFTLPKNSSSMIRINLKQEVQKEAKFFFCVNVSQVGTPKDIMRSIKYFVYIHLIPFFGNLETERKKITRKNSLDYNDKQNKILYQLASHVPQEIFIRLCSGVPTKPTVQLLKSAVLILDISGFTTLTHHLSQAGKSGGETITEYLNSYFSMLITVVHKHGGDVAKFVGDALICLFTNEPHFTANPDPLDVLLLRAVHCAMEIQKDCSEYSREGLKLTLHIAVGAGELSSMIVGGINKTWHYFVSGSAISNLNSALESSTTGEVVVSGNSWHLVEKYCTAEQRGLDWKINKVDRPPQLRRLLQFDIAPGCELASRSIIPYFVQNAYERGARVDELRKATVMFIKLSNIKYTDNVEENCEIINHLVVLMQKEIFRQEGMIIQFFEDEKGTLLLASFGLPPLSHGDDPIRCVKAAIGVYLELQKVNINSAIGVTTGDLFCGLVGSATRKEYTIISSSVNLASRIMGVVSKMGGGVLCDQTTRDACYPRLQFETLEPVVVKGTVDPVPIYRPDINSCRIQEIITSDISTVIVGRKKILHKIKTNLHELVRGHHSWVTIITGAEGMGKTTTSLFAIQLANKLGVVALYGESDPIQISTPFYVWQNIVRKILGVNFDGVSQEPLTSEKVLELCLALECEEKFLPLFNSILSINLPSNPEFEKLVPGARNSLIIRLITKLIEKQSQKKPLLIVIENLHWVDTLSLTLASNVTKLETPTLLLATTRPIQETEVHKFSKFFASPSIRHINLFPLSQKQSEKLAINLFGAAPTVPLPSAVLSIITKSQGNPFFCTELLMGFRDSKLIDVNEKREWMISPEVNITEIPCSIESAINSRLDCLAASTQDILKIASVIGKDFEISVLEYLANEKSVESKLKLLVKMNFLTQNKPFYSFKNETVLKIVYSRLLYAQRKDLHQKLANYYKNSEHYQQNIPLLAYHWNQVVIASKIPSFHAISQAIKYMKLAGELASKHDGEKNEASNWFERALELLQHQEELYSKEKEQDENSSNMKKLKLQVMGIPWHYGKFSVNSDK